MGAAPPPLDAATGAGPSANSNTTASSSSAPSTAATTATTTATTAATAAPPSSTATSKPALGPVPRLPALHPQGSHALPPPRQQSPQSMQTSPSTVKASPLTSSRPVVPIASGSDRPVAEPRRRTDQGGAARMRSSIACERCRRSKVKCNNAGAGTRCQACTVSNRECVYPEPGTGSGRRESVMPNHPIPTDRDRVNGQAEAPPRKRQKRAIAAPSHIVPVNGAASDLLDLDPQVLTPKVWKELFEIYQRHFASDLPFVHGATFRKLLQQPLSNEPSSRRSASSNLSHYSELFLLAFLALTSRFHEAIVARYDPPTYQRSSDPLRVAERYAESARSRLHQVRDQHKMVERVQASLMLCLHEWGMCEGAKAWLSMHDAVAHAQLLGFYYEDKDKAIAPVHPINPNSDFINLTQYGPSQGKLPSMEDSPVEQEIKRRTFWSCFIMDRYLSGGYMRPNQIRVKDIFVQLPASDDSFTFGRSVRTRRLGEQQDEPSNRPNAFEDQSGPNAYGFPGGSHNSPGRGGMSYDYRSPQSVGQGYSQPSEIKEMGENEGPLSCYVRALSLYGEVINWSCTGGRRRQQGGKHLPPWNEDSEFYQLDNKLTEFKNGLPNDLRLCDSNTTAHSGSKSPTHYILMHLALLLCDIMLHREWVPFLPFACTKPEGPLDEPLVKEPPPAEFPNYWEDAARKCFKAARDIIDLLSTYQEWDSLVETPVSGFATFQVGVCGIYCMFFPQMDPDGYMCRPKVEREAQRLRKEVNRDLSDGEIATRKALGMLVGLQTRLKMARGWCRTLANLGEFCKIKHKEFKRKQAVSSPESGASSTSSSNEGAGLEEYKKLEKYLKGYYSLSDDTGEEDKVMTEVDFSNMESKESDAGSDGLDSKAHTDDTPRPISTPQPWATVNPAKREQGSETPSLPAAVPLHESKGERESPHDRFRAYEQHHLNGHGQGLHTQYNGLPNSNLSAQRSSLGLHHQVHNDAAASNPMMIAQPQPHINYTGYDQSQIYNMAFAPWDSVQFCMANSADSHVPTNEVTWLDSIRNPSYPQ